MRWQLQFICLFAVLPQIWAFYVVSEANYEDQWLSHLLGVPLSQFITNFTILGDDQQAAIAGVRGSVFVMRGDNHTYRAAVKTADRLQTRHNLIWVHIGDEHREKEYVSLGNEYGKWGKVLRNYWFDDPQHVLEVAQAMGRLSWFPLVSHTLTLCLLVSVHYT